MRHLACRGLLATVLIGAATPLHAQTGPERAVVDSLFAELVDAGDSNPLPPPTRCQPYSGTLGRFCQQILNVARLSREPEEKLAFSTEMAMRRVVDERPKWATAWYVLGIDRVQLPRAGVTAREGVLQPLGSSAEAGAGHALVHALELEPDLLVAAEALALVPIPREGADALLGRRDMLRRVRHALPLSPAARMGAAIVERESGSPDTAMTMFREAMDAGADSGVAMIEMARMLYKGSHTAEGRAMLLEGAGHTGSARADARYREELAWVASPSELVEWDSTAVADRPRWLGAFWADRDIHDGLADGERLVEHYRRYEEAMREFRIVIPQKGRQRLRSVALAGDAMVLEGGSVVTPGGAGRGGASSRSGTPAEPIVGATIEGMERERAPVSDYLETVGAGSPFRDFGINQDVLDDRGVVWIRHGKPTERTLTSGGIAMEGWRYARAPERDLVLFFAEADFDGQAGASVLIPTPAGTDGQAINQLCGNAKGMCDDLLRFSKPEGPMNVGSGRLARMGTPIHRAPGQDVINDARNEGRAEITRAVTTDDDRPEFDELLQPVVQFFGLDRAGGGEPRLLLAFAIPGDKLQGYTPPAAGGRTVYPIRIRLMASVRGSPRRFDLDTIRNFAVREPLQAGQYLTATLELPLPPGRYEATAVITEGEDRGALSRLDGVHVPAAVGHLTLSSLVLGREGTGVTWSSGRSTVALNPLNAYPKDGEAQLYYQLGGLRGGSAVRTQVQFFKDGEDKRAALSLSYDDRADQAWIEVHRAIGLKNLDAGLYRIRVTVTAGEATATEEAILAVVDR